MNLDSSNDAHIEKLARSVHMETSLHHGEAIGHALLIASDALASLGSGAMRLLAHLCLLARLRMRRTPRLR